MARLEVWVHQPENWYKYGAKECDKRKLRYKEARQKWILGACFSIYMLHIPETHGQICHFSQQVPNGQNHTWLQELDIHQAYPSIVHLQMWCRSLNNTGHRAVGIWCHWQPWRLNLFSQTLMLTQGCLLSPLQPGQSDGTRRGHDTDEKGRKCL